MPLVDLGKLTINGRLPCRRSRMRRVKPKGKYKKPREKKAQQK